LFLCRYEIIKKREDESVKLRKGVVVSRLTAFG
jgi:hypothetical protein